MSNSLDVKHILDDLTRIQTLVVKFNKDHQERFHPTKGEVLEGDHESLNDLLTPLTHAVQEMKEIIKEWSGDPTPQRAGQLLVTFQVVSAEPDAVSARLGSVGPQALQKQFAIVQGAWSGVSLMLKRIIQSLSARLWSLVKSHLKLKEWSIKGQVSAGVSAGLGLSGTAEVELVFEA